MRDVALSAGVSLKTVSRVVNNEPRVRPETFDRVSAAIQQLGFHRNDLARSLRPGQSSSTLGLVIGDVGNQFFSSITRAVEQVARERGYLLVAASSGEDERHERELVAALLARHRDGARSGVRHLIERGHRRIGLLADNIEIFTAAQRVEGYRDALAEACLPIDEELLVLDCGDVPTAEAATRSLLDMPDPPTALFTINNRMSLGALRFLRRSSERVDVVAFDDLEFADLIDAPITVVSNDPYEMGRLAATVMLARLAGDVSPPRRIVLQTTLVTQAGEVAR
jgi:LacI family transcriptional regulator